MKRYFLVLAILAVGCFAFAAFAGQMITGTVTGTGTTSINVSTGFVPDAVKVTNITNGTARVMWWDKGMGAGHGAYINGTSGPKMIAVNGITTYPGDSTHAAGFTIGQGTGSLNYTNQVNKTADTLSYEAYQ